MIVKNYVIKFLLDCLTPFKEHSKVTISFKNFANLSAATSKNLFDEIYFVKVHKWWFHHVSSNAYFQEEKESFDYLCI